MRAWLRAAPLTLLALCLTLALAGCGSDDDEGGDTTTTSRAGELSAGLSGREAEAATTVEDYIAAFESADVEGICDLTSPEEDRHEECVASLEGVLAPSEQPNFKLESVKVSGEQATVNLKRANGKGQVIVFRLREVDGQWQVEVAGFA